MGKQVGWEFRSEFATIFEAPKKIGMISSFADSHQSQVGFRIFDDVFEIFASSGDEEVFASHVFRSDERKRDFANDFRIFKVLGDLFVG